MKTTLSVLLGLGLTMLCSVGLAQEEEESMGYTYATYLYCDTTKESEMDDQIAEFDVPIMDKLVSDGVMNAWGWMRHHTGGEWRRIRWFSADTVEGTLTALDKMGAAMDAAEGENDAPSDACTSHDDYIWEVLGGTAGKDRGKAGMSVYYSCKISDEARADEIFKELFAPVMDKAVEDGKLTSWGWQSHVIGGWFRRLQTITAKDYGSLLSARQEILDTVYADDSELGAEFAEICGPHHDYLWDIVHETRN